MEDLDKLINDKKFDIEALKFEEGVKLLEQLIVSVESSGGADLEKLLLAYEKGNKLLTSLRAKLQGAEEKLKVLAGN